MVESQVRSRFPSALHSPLVWTALFAVVLAGFTAGGRAFAVFWQHEMQGWQWLSVPATIACILVMAAATYLAVTHPSPLAIIGATINAVAFLSISLAYVGLGAIWPLVNYIAWGVQAALPEVAGILGALMVGLAIQAARTERQQAQDVQWQLLDQQNKRQQILNERYALQNKRLELKQAGATRMVTRTVQQVESIQVHGEGKQPSAQVLALLGQAQASSIDVLDLSERALASALGCSSWLARQVKLLAKARASRQMLEA